MEDKEVCTIELNLDDDFSSSCSYHVDYLSQTIKRNVQHAETKQKTNRWVLVGLAYGLSEAMEKAQDLRVLLCKKHNRQPKDIF